MDPRETYQLLQTALTHHQSGRASEAEAIYRRVLAAAPNHPDALHLLGVVEAQRGNVAVALPLLRRAVSAAPQMAEFHRHLGEVLAMANQHAEAINAFANALRIDPRDLPARAGAGSSLLAVGRAADAVEQFKAAAQLKPDDPLAVGNWGYALSRAGKHAEAVATLRRAVEIDPNCGHAWVQLAEAIWRGGDWDGAPAVARRGVELRPEDARAWLVLGNTLQTSGDLEEAAHAYRRVLALDPNSIDGHSNLALTLLKLGQASESLAMYEQIMSRWPSFNDARANRSLAMLTLGDFERGWQEYESRWSSPQFVSSKPSGMPRWTGEALGAGKTIVLVSEQGFGDTIQFVRYAPMVRERTGGAKVVVACPPDLVVIVQTVPGVDQVVPNGTALAHDVHAPLASLPGIFHTLIDTIPAKVPYMSADPSRLERWKQRFADDANMKVGIVWAGSASHQNDRARSCRLTDFAPLAGVANVTLYSLQKGAQASQLMGVPPADIRIIPLGEELRDFADTAAALTCLDLLISVDTSVVHLAGALARPVWTLLSRGPDFRWMLEREDSPWYPTMRLFRQERIRQWQPVMQRVAAELAEFVEQKKE